MTDTTKLADELLARMSRSNPCSPTCGSRPLIEWLFANEARLHAALRAPDAEPVAWCDPLDIAESRENFMACSNAYERCHDNLRYKTPLYAAINGPAACANE